MKKNIVKKWTFWCVNKINLKKVPVLVLFVLSSFNTYAKNLEANGLLGGVDINTRLQEVTITGNVIDSNGQPLAGANILEKGTTNGTQTDFDGKFSISVSNSAAVLAISYIGYFPQEIAINGQATVTVTLQEDASLLDEVVLIGYGTQRKSDVTGAVASVKTEELEELPLTRVDQALQGRVPGVLIQNNDGAPNSTVNIRIRGANSLSAGNNPLVVIDGFQGGNLNTVNPNDIASIEVLKDASATAIYGSRGSNGVILVTTKQGKQGKATIEYNTFFSVRSIRKKLDLLNAADYAETVNAHRAELGIGGGTPVFSAAEIEDFRASGGTDWQDEIYRDAYEQNHVLSISGANDDASYYVSANVIDREGIIRNTSYTRYSVRSNISAKLAEKLKVTANIYLSREEDHPTDINTFARGATGNNNSGSPVFSSQLFAPTKPIFESDGNYSQPGGGVGPPTNFNPLALAVEPIRDNFINTTSFNGIAEYDITNKLKLSVSGSYRQLDVQNNLYANSKPTNAPGTEFASILDEKNLTLQNTNQLTYTNTFNDVHNLTVTAVMEQQYREFSQNVSSAIGFLTDGVTYNNLSLGTTPAVPQSRRTSRNLVSYVGRASYSYDNLYSLNLTGRSDGSSVFGTNNKHGFFFSAGGAWNISNESFLEASEAIDNLKLRASYGEIGNEQINPYLSLSRLSTTIAVLDGTSGSVGVVMANVAANPDLKWETTKQFNIGVDLDLFNSRLNLTADYYNKSTEDLLLYVPLPGTSGVGRVLRNIGEVENKGVEFYLGGKPFDEKFKWESGFNMTFNKNKVLALAGGDEIALGGPGLPGFGNTVFLEVGESIGQLRGYQQDGVWTTSEATEAASFGSIPGAPKYIDQNGDGAINSADITVIGETQPKYTFGWNNTFKYENLDLTVFLQGVQGNDIYNIGRVRSERSTGDADATNVAILNRWTPQNENTNVPSFTGTTNHEFLQSSRWIEDGSYIRIQNIILGYNLPSSILGKINMDKVRFFVSGTNLITITDYTGFDPESSTNVDTLGGIDLASFPSQKAFTFGLDLKF
ncbi:MAG: TonB-dependent receptor [Flavobacteriaceae bacterium]